MGASALRVFRVRGLYYSVLERFDGEPSGVGKEFISEIPSDPVAFQEWKSGKIEHFRAEEVRLRIMIERGMRPPDCMDFWGYYCRPSYRKPRPPSLGWTYIVDLDTDTFTITRTSMVSRKFRIENIPRSMFARASNPLQLMVSPVPQSHMVDSHNFDPELVALYKSSGARVAPLCPTVNNGNWSIQMMLRHMLIRKYTYHYGILMQKTNNDREANNFFFRLLIYGLLNICNISVGLTFEHEVFTGSYQDWQFAIPSWEVPASPEYTLNSVIIVVEPRMQILECLQAAIGKAVLMAKTRPESRTAMIVSFDSVAIIQLSRTDDILTLSHTENLLFCPRYLYNSYLRIPSAGINAVFEVFANQICTPCTIPARFPAELWEEIFLHSAASSQTALRSSCQFFHSLARRFPRVGGWTLRRAEKDDCCFITTPEGAGQKCVIYLMEFGTASVMLPDAYKVVLFVGGERMEPGLPLLGVRR